MEKKNTISTAMFHSYVQLPKDISHKIPLNPIKPLFSYGSPMVFLWFSYGFPVVMLTRFPHLEVPGHMISALKVMQLLAEEGCSDGEMTEAIGWWVKKRYIYIYIYIYILVGGLEH